MLRLVTIDLTGADLERFESYEDTVLSLAGKHGGRLELRLRAVDGSSETHLLFFPDTQAFENYRADPERLSAQDVWRASGAKSSVIEVEVIRSQYAPAGSP